MDFEYTLITVCYNSVKTIEDTIISILNQDNKNFQYLIIDGGSKDGTIDIIKKYVSHFQGRLEFFSEKDDGLYFAINKGLKLSKGKIIGILNSDDIFFDSKVLSEVSLCFNEFDTDCVYGNLYVVDRNNTDNILRDCVYEEYKAGMFLRGWHPPHPGLFVKKAVYNKYGYFDTNYRISADFEIMLRLFEKFKISSHHLEKYLVRMRNDGLSSRSISNRIEAQKECLIAFKKNDIKINPLFYFLSKYYQKLKQFKVLWK